MAQPLPGNETVRVLPRQAAERSVWAARQRALTIGLLLTVTLAAFEMLAVATAMPVVVGDLGMLSLYGWVFSAFMLGELVGIVGAGVLIDRDGLVAPYTLGVALFALGLAIGGLAPSMPVLVAARALQGIGGGAVPTTAYVAIQREYAPRLRPTMMFYLSSAWIVPGLVGPAIAGLVAEQLTWRVVFLGLLPLAALAALLTVPSLRALAGATYGEPVTEAEPERVALAGRKRLLLALGVAAGAGLVLAALDSPLPLSIALAAGGLVVGLPALVRLLPPGTLLARHGLPATVLLRGLVMFGFGGAEAYVPLALVSVRGISAGAAGLTLTASTITWALGSWLQARSSEHLGQRRLIGIGLAIVCLGVLLVLPVLDGRVPVAFAVLAWAVAGLGMGMSYPSITLRVMSLAPHREQGFATAALQLSDQTGTALGAGVGGAILAFGISQGAARAATLAAVFGLMAVVLAAGVAVSRRVGRRGSR